MKIANVRGMVTKAMLVGTAAAAFMFASAPKAQAQSFVAVEVGYPHYDYARHDRFEFERRQAFLRHEEWARLHRFDRPYGFGPR